MFRKIATFLVIFLLVNHEIIVASNYIDRNSLREIDREIEALESYEPEQDDEVKRMPDEDMKSQETNTREKRKYGALLRNGIALLAGGAFLGSTAVSIYGAIRKCNDYVPSPCKYANCTYLSPCPDVCTTPDKNRDFVEREKAKLRSELADMDNKQLYAFNLATKSISASLKNKRILTDMKRINGKVSQLMFDMVEMDGLVAEKFRNNSVEIRKLIRNAKLTLEDIVASGEIQGIFDKWTWEGTGAFTLSIALPLGLSFYGRLKERYAISKLAKEMKSDFAQRFQNQKGANGNQIKNKFAYVQGYDTKNINKQIYKTAKASYYTEKSVKKLTKTEKFTQNVLGPLVNIIVIGLSVWSTYNFHVGCQQFTRDLQNSALLMANKMNEVQDLKINKVLPLYNTVKNETWQPVRDFLTSNQLAGWLIGVRNLTEGANVVNTTAVNLINNFLTNIPNPSISNTINLQKIIIDVLENMDFQIGCIEKKQHAIAIVMKDCKAGRLPLADLYQEASRTYQLNADACITRKMVPYTTVEQFRTIINAFAQHQGWYSTCLLNNNDLRDRVCQQKLKGYTTNAEIIKHANRTGLTDAMVTNFLTRCPPPKITPKGIQDACKLYCLYDNVTEIAKSVILLTSQVNQIIRDNCTICPFRADQKSSICNLHFCKNQNASTIEPQVRLPLPTVIHVINKVCVQKCVVDAAQKKSICDNYKCKALTASEIAAIEKIPVSTVNEVIPNCETILPKCEGLTAKQIEKIMQLHCANFSPAQISFFLDISIDLINETIANNKCP